MRSALAIAAALGCSGTPAPTTTTPVPRGTIDELNFLVGTWHADAENPQTKQRFTLEYTVEPMVQGIWYRGTGHVPVLSLDIHDVWGKDPVSGEIVRTIFDSAGTVGTVRSKGFTGGNVLVLEGEVATRNGRGTVRETITVGSPHDFTAVWESRNPDGSWSAYSVETLRRLAPPTE